MSKLIHVDALDFSEWHWRSDVSFDAQCIFNGVKIHLFLNNDESLEDYSGYKGAGVNGNSNHLHQVKNISTLNLLPENDAVIYCPRLTKVRGLWNGLRTCVCVRPLYHERSFLADFENRKNCSLSELHGCSLFRTFNSYSFNFNGGLRKRQNYTAFVLLRTPSPRGKQFLWFFMQIHLLRFHRIYLLFGWSKLLFFLFVLDVLQLRINLPNLCPNMIHVDALDFSEWHSEEVISFFWRSKSKCIFNGIN